MAASFYVYVLRSLVNGRRYVGSCQDIDARLDQHNAGESKSTKHGVPWKLVYFEQVATRSAAVGRERFFKTGTGRDELDRIELEKQRSSQVEIPG